MAVSPTNVFLVELDTRPVLSLELEDTDLAQFTSITLRMRRPDGTVVEVEATIDDEPNGLFHFEWGADDLQQGTSEIEIVFVGTDDSILTLPAEGPIRGVVRKKI